VGGVYELGLRDCCPDLIILDLNMPVSGACDAL